jgi:hypothetical protein
VEAPEATSEPGGLGAVAVVVPGWAPRDEPLVYVGDSLFELINGGAELYHQHGFVQALAVDYTHETGSEIALEVFEMGDADGAQIVFASKAGETGESVDVGDEARLESYYMNTRVGRYVVTITGFDSEPVTAEGVLAIGQAVAAELGGLS